MVKRFSRNIEDFICEYCHTKVNGDGYTNHCPQCLYSKHVDVNPGDRYSSCQGLMEPIGIEPKGDKMIILHRCLQCKTIKRNRTSSSDDFSTILRLMEEQAKK